MRDITLKIATYKGFLFASKYNNILFSLAYFFVNHLQIMKKLLLFLFTKSQNFIIYSLSYISDFWQKGFS